MQAARRWLRPVRPWWADEASSTAPTTRTGSARSAYRWPPIVAVPALGMTRLSRIRKVVVLPAPLGPRKPVTRPGSTVKESRSTAVTPRYCLLSSATAMC